MQTFVVRLFVSAASDPVPFCGFVDRVGACERIAFHDAEELVAALQRVDRPSDDSAAATDRREHA